MRKQSFPMLLQSLPGRIVRWIGRIVARFLPGLVLGAVLFAAYSLSQELNMIETGEQYRRTNGFHHAETALEKTGLGSLAYDAANKSLHYDAYFRDGDSLTLFHVQERLRESVMAQIASAKGWQSRQVTGEEYEQLARQFRPVASSVRPDSEVVFDAYFYKDLFFSVHGKVYDEQRVWEWLPDWLNMNGQPYTTDYRFAFYDVETGLFICYDQTA